MAKPPDPIFTLRGHTAPVNCLSVQNNLLVSGSNSSELFLWNLQKKRLTSQKILENSILNTEIFYKDKILSLERQGVLKMWDLPNFSEESEPLTSFETNSSTFCKFSALAERNLIATNGNNISDIIIIDQNTNEVISTINPEKNPDEKKFGMCMHLKLFETKSTNTIHIAAAYENGGIYFWDLANISSCYNSLKISDNPSTSFELDTEKEQGILGFADEYFSVFSFGSEPCTEIKKFEINSGISDIKIRNDKKIFVSGGWDKRLRIFSWKKLKPLAILKYHEESIQSVNFTEENILISTGDKKIALWKIY